MTSPIKKVTNYFESAAPNSKLVKSCLEFDGAYQNGLSCFDYGSEKGKMYFKGPHEYAGGNFTGISYYTQPNNVKVKKFVGSSESSPKVKVTCPLGTLLTGYDTVNNKPKCAYNLNSKNCVSRDLIINDKAMIDNISIDFLTTCSNDIDLSYCPEISTIKTRQDLNDLAKKIRSELDQEFSSNTQIKELEKTKSIDVYGVKMLPILALKNEFPELYKKAILYIYLKKYSDSIHHFGMPFNYGYDTIPICANYVKNGVSSNEELTNDTSNDNSSSGEYASLNLGNVYLYLFLIILVVLLVSVYRTYALNNYTVVKKY
jgi:hypothetical protein